MDDGWNATGDALRADIERDGFGTSRWDPETDPLHLSIKVCTVCDVPLGSPHNTGDHSRAGWRRVAVVPRSEADRVAAALSDVCDNTLTIHDARLVAADYWGGK